MFNGSMERSIGRPEDSLRPGFEFKKPIIEEVKNMQEIKIDLHNRKPNNHKKRYVFTDNEEDSIINR